MGEGEGVGMGPSRAPGFWEGAVGFRGTLQSVSSEPGRAGVTMGDSTQRVSTWRGHVREVARAAPWQSGWQRAPLGTAWEMGKPELGVGVDLEFIGSLWPVQLR